MIKLRENSFKEVLTMEDRKRVALNDELLDRVAGGTRGFGIYKCPCCGFETLDEAPCLCPLCGKEEMIFFRS